VNDSYPVYELQSVAGEAPAHGPVVAPIQQQNEQMGSKQKFWLCDHWTGVWYLFKYAREGTGEHWSEKVACELADLLGLPHARVELAADAGAPGVLVEDIRTDRETMSLLHGNELLVEVDPAYPHSKGYRVSEHTVQHVAAALEAHGVELPDPGSVPRPLPPGVDDAVGLFIGYLLLDAIIANTDRHHENWAVIARRQRTGARSLQLAPTYDHASSLGRELRDPARARRLSSGGAHGLAAYARRARSGLYASRVADTPLSPAAAFAAASSLRPAARAGWLQRCRELGPGALQQPLQRLPAAAVTQAAVAFASALIGYNYAMLLETESEPLR